MSDTLQEAIVAIKANDKVRGKRLLTQILKKEPHNETAWVWMSGIVDSDAQRRNCLERILTINPNNTVAQHGLAALEEKRAEPAGSPSHPPEQPPTASHSHKNGGAADASTNVNELPTKQTGFKIFTQKLKKNYNILKAREAKYANAAPLDLLNQIDDYEQAIELARQAEEEDLPLEQLQDEFNSFNLHIDTVVFIGNQEPPRKSFTGENPYRGLRKFTAANAHLFFGRTEAIQSLLETVDFLVQAETSREEPDLIAVLGPSGSGKSSLVRAGLLPALQANQIEGSEEWLVSVMQPDAYPLDELAMKFTSLTGRGLPELRADLESGPNALHQLMRESLERAGKSSDAIFVLVIDQFEELFTLVEDEEERQTFLEQLLYVAQRRKNRGFIILTMRADFYGKAASYKALANAITLNQMLVSPLTERELREAILLPAEAVGLELEKALVETLLKDTADAPGVLPLLQQALTELFNRRDGNLLTLEAYREIGGVQGALAHHADTLIDSLPMEQRHIARRIFMRLVQPGEGTADTRRRARYSEILSQGQDGDEIDEVLQLLIEAHLVVTGRSIDNNEIMIDVSHEALIKEWPRFQSWLDWDRQGLRIRQQLGRATQEWVTRDRDNDILYRGARLMEAEEWIAGNPDEVNPTEAAFIEASVTVRDTVQAAQEAQRQRELETAKKLAQTETRRAHEAELREKEQARATRRLRKRQVALVLISILAVFLGVRAFINEGRADHERRQAVAARQKAEAAQGKAEILTEKVFAEHLADQAKTILPHNPQLALLLALEAQNIFSTTEHADGVVAQAPYLYFPVEATLDAHKRLVRHVEWSPDGTQLASASEDQTVIIWDRVSGQPIKQLSGHTGFVTSVTWSPNGAKIASSSRDNTIIIWDVATGQKIDILAGHATWVNDVAWSPDGTKLASASQDNTVMIWDVTSGQQLETLEGHTNWVLSVDWHPTGTQLVSSSQDKTIIIWDLTSGQGTILEGHTNWVAQAQWSPDGTQVASASADQTIIVWDLVTAQPAQTLNGHSDWVWSITWSHNGEWLVSASEDEKIIVWDLKTSEPITTLSGQGSPIYHIAHAPDETRLATASQDSSITIWNLGNERPAFLFEGHQDWVNSVAWSPTDNQIATASGDQTVMVWHSTTGEVVATLRGHSNWISSVAWNPSGTQLASGAADDTVIIWDLATQQPLHTLPGHTAWVYSVAWSPNGQQIASASVDKTIILWDAASGQALNTLEGHTDQVRSVVWSPDGSQLASGSDDKTIIIWDAATGQQVKTLVGHTGTVRSVAWSPDGRQIASGSTDPDKRVMVWDVATGQAVTSHQEHTLRVLSVGWNPDGSKIVSGSDDETVIVWDPVNNQSIRLIGHTGGIRSVAWSPNGSQIASTSSDQTVHVLKTRFIRPPCEWLSRNLTQEEWLHYLGNERPYHEVCNNIVEQVSVIDN